jgi:hypothetical protein
MTFKARRLTPVPERAMPMPALGIAGPAKQSHWWATSLLAVQLTLDLPQMPAMRNPRCRRREGQGEAPRNNCTAKASQVSSNAVQPWAMLKRKPTSTAEAGCCYPRTHPSRCLSPARGSELQPSKDTPPIPWTSHTHS